MSAYMGGGRKRERERLRLVGGLIDFKRPGSEISRS